MQDAKLQFIGEIVIALGAMQCLRIAGERIATPVCATGSQ